MKSSVLPSGSAVFTASTPVRPDAPTRFSTITVLGVAAAQLLADDARQHVRSAARREGHDDSYRLCRRLRE